MEPTVVSGPVGHAQWEPEQPFPLGFQPVDPDCRAVLSPSSTGQTGLDFRKGDYNDAAPQKSVEKPVALEDLITVSAFSCEDLQLEDKQASAYLQGLTLTESFEEISDSTLSWLFSPNLTDVMRKELTLKADSHEESNAVADQGDLISLGSPFNVSRRNSAEPFLLVDLSGVTQDSPSELNAQIAAEEQAAVPPSQTLSPETGDKGLFPDQVTDLPLTSSSAESCHSPPLLDFDSPASVVPKNEAQSAVSGHVPSEERSENDEDAVDLMEDPSSYSAKTQSNQEEMALDLCLTAEEVHDDDGGSEERQHQVEAFDLNQPPLPAAAGNASQDDMSSLKAVFDALDQDGDGFVRIEEFLEFAAVYGADQVKDLTKCLDPSGLGVISFEDFHRGISAISDGAGPELQLYSYNPGDGAGGCPEEYDENEVTDSAYLGSESTYSECETFTDEDTGALVPPEMHEDVETDSGIEATLHDPDDRGSRFSLTSELHSHSLVTVISGEEEHFEDFGESNTSDLLLESSVDDSMGKGDATLSPPPEQINGCAVISPSAPACLPDCFQSFLREEALDFFCSQCHRQISRLEDLSTRLNFLEMTSAGKRLSSKKVARHLLQNSSMTLDTMSDLTRDILELADNDITDKVLLLERRVAELEKESEASGEQHARLRQENLQLVHRANALEEQLKEQELQANEQLQQENRRHKEALCKLEREKGLELENAQARLQQLDDENSELRSCVPCLRANIERLEEEKQKLQDEVETQTDRLNEETESRRKMADKLSHERHQNQKEKESTQELIEDLRKQLEHLQLYKLEAEAKRGRTPGAGLQEYQTRTREAELEQEIKRLKQDNRTLKEQNDELNGQIINLSIQGAKNLMSASFSDSLAAEISSVSRAELMEAVHKQEEINYRLQDYIDKIIVAIMESNPSILEVK
ncbi:rab11 family-interacting protein 3 isoform X3 [Poeciliopsis prolifica]|uniref:rab11 family-interacting protein 3 isoform X3 n=1 Tax=Poeciliopsis prolifica TaxID=188132 RepID=UPI00241430B6|nr:rab11 family-interacting protein 3 isoform X3 [Poeciliopsis prolifica]